MCAQTPHGIALWAFARVFCMAQVLKARTGQRVPRGLTGDSLADPLNAEQHSHLPRHSTRSEHSQSAGGGERVRAHDSAGAPVREKMLRLVDMLYRQRFSCHRCHSPLASLPPISSVAPTFRKASALGAATVALECRWNAQHLPICGRPVCLD